jgi:hypothetical protein
LPPLLGLSLHVSADRIRQSPTPPYVEPRSDLSLNFGHQISSEQRRSSPHKNDYIYFILQNLMSEIITR